MEWVGALNFQPVSDFLEEGGDVCLVHGPCTEYSHL